MYKSISYNGVMFPEEFPYYKGYLLNDNLLSKEAEEIIYAWAIRQNTDYVKSDIAHANFINSLKGTVDVLQLQSIKENSLEFQHIIKDMFNRNEKIKESKKNLTKEQKEQKKAQTEQNKEKYGFAIIDGKKIPLGGYIVENASPIIVRGKDKRMFAWKHRVEKKDVTINIVNDNECKKRLESEGYKVVSKPDVDWIVKYDIKLSGGFPSITKTIRPSANSEYQQSNTEEKYEKAYNLLKHFKEFDKEIEKKLNSTKEKDLQIGLATWLIKNFAIRVGNEQEEFKAQTEGVTTLKNSSLKITKDGQAYFIILDFLGKDSVPFFKKEEITKSLAEKFLSIKERKTNKDEIFDKISSTDVSLFIKSIYKDASPKTFRSAIGTSLLCEELAKANVEKDWKDYKKKEAFIKANAEVAKKLNHQKGINANSEKSFNDMKEKYIEKIEKYKVDLKTLQDNFKHEKEEIDSKIKIAKEKGMKDLVKKYKNSLEKKKEKIEKKKESIMKIESQLSLKKDSKNIALGTSLNSYCSPKVVKSWCKDVNLPITNIYTKTQIAKFEWADGVDSNYWKKYLGLTN